MSKRCARAAAAVIATVALLHADPAHAYLKFGVRANDQNVTLKWAQVPVRYFVSTSNQNVPGVTIDAFQTAVGRAFATWQAVPTASIAYQFAGFTAALPDEDDGMSIFCSTARPGR